MLQGVLPWEGKSVGAYTGSLECHAIRMEAMQSLLHGRQ